MLSAECWTSCPAWSPAAAAPAAVLRYQGERVRVLMPALGRRLAQVTALDAAGAGRLAAGPRGQVGATAWPTVTDPAAEKRAADAAAQPGPAAGK